MEALPPSPPAPPCPSCRAPMEVHALEASGPVAGTQVELDLCFSCQGLWFDPAENLKLTPGAVAELLRLMHAHQDAPIQSLAHQLQCPHCRSNLQRGFDVVRTGRYVTYRCTKGHGRFSPFSSFMIEKGFVRPLTRPEVDDIAKTVRIIHCTSCGAPVDLRQDHVCPHCRSAFSLLDPAAVEKALQGYAKAVTQGTQTRPHDLADALISLERDRERARREQATEGRSLLSRNASEVGGTELLAVGLSMVWKLLN